MRSKDLVALHTYTYNSRKNTSIKQLQCSNACRESCNNIEELFCALLSGQVPISEWNINGSRGQIRGDLL